jgi:hypothetical protein
MSRILFLFVDGVGLGPAEAATNPFAALDLPNLQALLGGQRLLAACAPYEGPRASLLALDACLGVPGLPQSATGQAALLTGQNVPAALGYHYGPKPDPAVAAILRQGSLFSTLRQSSRRAALLNAYPPRYFEVIRSGRRLYSAIPLAVASAGMPLKSAADLFTGQALSADFTGQGWRSQLGIAEAPLLTPAQAGRRLAALAAQYDLAFFEFWPSDYAGHHQSLAEATHILELLDQVLGGLLAAWDDDAGLILITSDHGNLEDLATRTHTINPVPALLIGRLDMRRRFASGLRDLTGIVPAILSTLV